MIFKEYSQYDAYGLAELIKKKEISTLDAVESAINKIEELNPEINAVIYQDYEAALANAKEKESTKLGGLPFLTKGLGAMVKGFPYTFCSKLFRKNVAVEDSNLIKRYKNAGAIIIGQTNAPEFGINITTEPALHGPTRNPWNTEYSSGGSSGGAAAAVASGMVPVAHASDGGGSIRIPASCCGVFGLKPTRGRISHGPAGEGWGGLVAEHVISKSVRDSAWFLDLTNGPSLGDPYFAPPPSESYLENLDSPPKKLKIAYTTSSLSGEESSQECVAAVQKTLVLLESMGHELVEQKICFDYEKTQHHIHNLIICNLKGDLEAFESARGSRIRSEELEALSYRIHTAAPVISGYEYVKSIRYLHSLSRNLAGKFEQFDMFLTPTLATPPPLLNVLRMDTSSFEEYWRKLFRVNPFCGIFNVTGQPAASIPMHITDERLPVGVQIAGKYADEERLLKLCRQLELASPWKFPSSPTT